MPDTWSSIPRKRPRSEISEGEAWTRHGELWFDDGNVVLIAEKTAFRVHKSILTRHSEVFRDMFALAQPATESEVVDGCPVVHLSDTVADLLHFLQPLFAGGTTPHFKDHVASFEMVSAMLRLGMKYAVPHIYDDALRRLRHAYPKTLEEWEKSRDEPGVCALTSDVTPVRIVLLIRAFDSELKSIIPSAFYACCQLPVRGLLRGHVGKNGQVERLSDDDLEACLTATKMLMETTVESFRHLATFGISPECHYTEDCEDSFLNILDLAGDAKDIIYCTDPLKPLKHWFTDKHRLCGTCDTHLSSLYDAERARTWKILKDVFNH